MERSGEKIVVRFFPIFVSLFLFSSGCLITKTQIQIKAKLDEIDARMKILEEKKADMSEVDKLITEIRKGLADLTAQIDEVEKKLSLLKGASEVERGFEILSKEIDKKVESLRTENVRAVELRLEEIKSSLEKIKVELMEIKEGYALFEKIIMDPEAAYAEAKELMKKGKDELAYMIFEKISTFHKGHHLVDDCYYMMAQIKEAKSDCKTALLHYGKIIKDYNNWLTPKAYLASGECLLKMGDKKKAKTFFQELIQRFPDSEEAKTAKKKMEKL